MRLSWNEIRSRAAAFAREWADAAYEKGETHSFYNDFFEIFGVRRRTVARYEEHVRRLDDTRGFIDLFWPGVLLVEQKSAGRGLAAARGQAGAYFDALPERDRPRYQLLCDFQTFELLDRDEREESRFALADLPAHVERFGFILGVQRRAFRDQDPVNVEASELVARLHDALKASGYDGRDLELCAHSDSEVAEHPPRGRPGDRRAPCHGRPNPKNGLRQLLTGSQPIDGGHHIFDAEQRSAFLDAEPDAAPLLRPYVGAREYLQGGERWILDLHDASPGALARLPHVRERIAAVRAWRRTSKRKSTLKLADAPTLWQVNVLPDGPFLVIPEVSSERREYVPIGWLEPPVVPSNLVRVLEGANKPTFALLTSAMHMAWAAAHRRTAEERLPLLRRPRLQHVPDAARVERRGVRIEGRRRTQTRGEGPVAPPDPRDRPELRQIELIPAVLPRFELLRSVRQRLLDGCSAETVASHENDAGRFGRQQPGSTKGQRAAGVARWPATPVPGSP